MMKAIYNTLRRNSVINLVVRAPLKFLHYLLPAFISRVAYRWRVSGVIDIFIDGKPLKFYAEGDDGIADALYYKPGSYEEYADLQLFSRLAAKSNVILDIGANTGIFSLAAASANKTAAIIAFEPYEINAKRLSKNLVLNNIENVTVSQQAVGDKAGTIDFTIPDDNRVCDVLSADRSFSEKYYRGQVKYKTIQVNQTSIDETVKALALNTVDLIKIDVESYEIAVFKGALNTLAAFSPVIFCEIFADEKRDRFYSEILKPLSYHFYYQTRSGLLYIDSIFNNPESRNFIFSKKKLSLPYISYLEMDKIVNELS